jgi:hypothetical protein
VSGVVRTLVGVSRDLLTRALAFIETHPDEVDLRYSAVVGPAGQRYGLDGLIAALGGQEPRLVEEFSTDDPGRRLYDRHATHTTGGVPISWWAALAVGVTDAQARQLFDRGNTVDDLRQIACDLDNGE